MAAPIRIVSPKALSKGEVSMESPKMRADRRPSLGADQAPRNPSSASRIRGFTAKSMRGMPWGGTAIKTSATTPIRPRPNARAKLCIRDISIPLFRVVWRARSDRVVISFPRTCVYRWASGNRTRIRTEPIPSELLKATGMQPCHEKSRTRQGFS